MDTPQRRPVIYRNRCYAMPRVDAIRALRSLLKEMLRRHGLRALSIEEEKPHRTETEKSA
jgi:hypothetical protein